MHQRDPCNLPPCLGAGDAVQVALFKAQVRDGIRRVCRRGQLLGARWRQRPEHAQRYVLIGDIVIIEDMRVGMVLIECGLDGHGVGRDEPALGGGCVDSDWSRGALYLLICW